MKFTAWFSRLHQWQRNYRHMLRERKEREKVLAYLETSGIDDSGELKDFFTRHCFNVYPYSWADECEYADTEVFFDSGLGMHYVDWNGKKLYWKKSEKRRGIRHRVNDLKAEQHAGSPHKYETANFQYAHVADLGAAEGIFALDVIDRVEHIYLFEADPEWNEPLRATFRPWLDKVTIVNQFVGDSALGGAAISLDEYFAEKPIDYIKADIEGAEVDMLRGGRDILMKKVKGVNICLYHTPDDARNIIALLEEYGYQCQANPGYMFFHDDMSALGACFRRGVVRGVRVS